MVVKMKILGRLKEIRRDLKWRDKLALGLWRWYLFGDKQIEHLENSHRLKEPNKVEGTEADTEKIRQVYDCSLLPERRPKINTKYLINSSKMRSVSYIWEYK